MPFRQKVFAILVALFLMALIIELVRRKRLREEFTGLWIATGVGVVVLVLWYDLLVRITSLIGAVLPTTTLFLFAFLFLVLICLYYSVKLSAMADQIKTLAQELALLKGERKEDGDSPA